MPTETTIAEPMTADELAEARRLLDHSDLSEDTKRMVRADLFPVSCFCPRGDFFRCTDPDCPNSNVNAREDYDDEELPDAN